MSAGFFFMGGNDINDKYIKTSKSINIDTNGNLEIMKILGRFILLKNIFNSIRNFISGTTPSIYAKKNTIPAIKNICGVVMLIIHIYKTYS